MTVETSSGGRRWEPDDKGLRTVWREVRGDRVPWSTEGINGRTPCRDQGGGEGPQGGRRVQGRGEGHRGRDLPSRAPYLPGEEVTQDKRGWDQAEQEAELWLLG